MKISNRLKECAKFVTPYRNVADVGTDHALLPIYLVKQNLADKVIASDVGVGPLGFAKRNVMSEGIKNIDVVLSDGIKHITDDTEVIIISGMGGKLIADILKDDLRNTKKLILQPNMAANLLRLHLQSIGFKITEEVVLNDNNIYYEIIIAEKGEMSLTEDEVIFGPINLVNKTEQFYKYWNEQLLKLEKTLSNIPTNLDNYKIIQKQINIIKKAI